MSSATSRIRKTRALMHILKRHSRGRIRPSGDGCQLPTAPVTLALGIIPSGVRNRLSGPTLVLQMRVFIYLEPLGDPMHINI